MQMFWDQNVVIEYFSDYQVLSFSMTWSFVGVMVQDSYIKIMTLKNLQLIKYLPIYNGDNNYIQFDKGIQVL
jgi:hypothetical protein